MDRAYALPPPPSWIERPKPCSLTPAVQSESWMEGGGRPALARCHLSKSSLDPSSLPSRSSYRQGTCLLNSLAKEHHHPLQTSSQ